MNRKYINAVLIITLILVVLFVSIYLFLSWLTPTEAEYQKEYEKAKTNCKVEIWPVYEDIGPVVPQESLKPPYPKYYKDAVAGLPYGYGCTGEEVKHLLKQHSSI